jgi:light-regulated signal transduction histidine kinase (bacteriophytochrome)
MVKRPFIEFVHPDDREPTLKEVERQVVKGERVLHFENRYRHKDGSWRWLSWQSVPQNDGLMYATARDVTAQKDAEERVKQLNQQLTAVNHELEAFAYSVSHDLRAPLRSIDGFSLALVEDCGDKLNDEERDHLARIRAATQRMGMLIDDLLNLSRVSRSELRIGKADLTALARDVVAELRQQEPQRRVEVRIAEGLKVEGDARLMRLVLQNLLGNAWKFTSKVENARIEFGSEQNGDGTAYFVRDNGAGFDMKYADKLFGAFQRLHSASEFPGTGIGLATVQRILHRHGGHVWATSELGKGATFYFQI